MPGLTSACGGATEATGCRSAGSCGRGAAAKVPAIPAAPAQQLAAHCCSRACTAYLLLSKVGLSR